jgi:ribose 5-phosphate isomerase RpiB
MVQVTANANISTDVSMIGTMMGLMTSANNWKGVHAHVCEDLLVAWFSYQLNHG